jgi:hypothetical protein
MNKKIIIILSMMLLVLPMVYAEMNTSNIIAFYPFDDDTLDYGNYAEGQTDLTNTNYQGHVTGVTNKMADFDGDGDTGNDDYAYNAVVAGTILEDIRTIQVVTNLTTYPSIECNAMEFGVSGTDDYAYIRVTSAGAIQARAYVNGGEVWALLPSSKIPLNTLVMMTVTFSTDRADFYWNGSDTPEVSDIGGTGVFNADYTKIHVNTRSQLDYCCNMYAEQIVLLDGRLEGSEIEDVWNSGSPLNVSEGFTGFTPDTTSPNINVSINNSIPKYGYDINISANVSDETELGECVFYHNETGSSEIYARYSIAGNDAQCNQNFTVSLGRGNVINYTVLVNDSSANSEQASVLATVQNSAPFWATMLNTSGKRFDHNVTFNWTDVIDWDSDPVTFTAYLNGSIVADGIDVFGWDTNVTDGYWNLSVDTTDGIDTVYGSQYQTWYFIMDSVPASRSNNITNNSYYNYNATFRYTTTSADNYNLTGNLTNGTYTFEYWYDDVVAGDDLELVITLNLTGLKSGNYTLKFESVESHSLRINDKILSKEVLSATNLKFEDSVINKEIELTAKFDTGVSSLFLSDVPADTNSYVSVNEEGYYTFGCSFTAGKDFNLVYDIDTTLSLKYLPDTGYKGHFMLYDKNIPKYGLDFEGELLVDGKSVDYTVLVDVINENNAEVRIIPKVKLAGGESVIFNSETIFGINYQVEEFNLIVDNDAPVCSFVSVTPSNMNSSSTGNVEIILNCSDAYLNTTSMFITRTFEGNITSNQDNKWSIRPPSNNRAIASPLFDEQRILLSDGRVLSSMWYESLFSDNYTYAVTTNTMPSGQNPYVTLTSYEGYTILNYTAPIEVAVFPSHVYISRGKMEKELKSDYSINRNDGMLIQFWDDYRIQGFVNYTTEVFFNINYTGIPNDVLSFIYCNSSYDLTAGTSPQDDNDNCAVLSSIPYTALDTRAYSSRNSSYVQGTFVVTDGKVGGVGTTPISYGYFRSLAQGVGDYTLRYATGATGTNVSFANSKVAWSSSDDGDTLTQFAGTPDVWFAQITDNGQFEMGIYAKDTLNNAFSNFTVYTDLFDEDINFSITNPNIESYDGNDDLNGTYSGDMTVKINPAIDGNAVGTVNHTLYVVSASAPYNVIYIINNSFYSPDDSAVNILWDTYSVSDGTYKMNISARANDDYSDFQSVITPNNFTIDNSKPITYPGGSSPGYCSGLGSGCISDSDCCLDYVCSAGVCSEETVVADIEDETQQEDLTVLDAIQSFFSNLFGNLKPFSTADNGEIKINTQGVTGSIGLLFIALIIGLCLVGFLFFIVVRKKR